MAGITLLAIIGAICLCFALYDSLWSVLELISSYLMPYFFSGKELLLSKRFGSWAVVTGGTDGIGKQYAKQLAGRGINVVIISRNLEKLKTVADEIQKEYHVETKIIVADFNKGLEVYKHIEEELGDIPVGILVNNVGSFQEYPMLLCEIDMPKIMEMINVNVGAVTAMSRMVLPGMVQRGRGALVNISSGAELQPSPFVAIYAATKAYVRSFTLSIREEYSSSGVYIQHVAPFFVYTNMISFSEKLMKGNMLVPDAATYAKHAVATLGRVQNTTGYWLHGFQCFYAKLFPVWLRTKSCRVIMNQFRRQYLAKQISETKPPTLITKKSSKID